jgi:hypothetical protein
MKVGLWDHLAVYMSPLPPNKPEETALARQWPGKHIPMAMNTHATVKELLEALFSM